MKKFISMVMAAAMVVSMVPATAFAAESTLKVDGMEKFTKANAEADNITKSTDLKLDDVQVQIKMTDADAHLNNGKGEKYEVKLAFDGAKMVEGANVGDDFAATFDATEGATNLFEVSVYDKDESEEANVKDVTYSMKDGDKKVTIAFTTTEDLADGDIVIININKTDDAWMGLTSKRVGHEATVSVVGGDLGTCGPKTVGAILDAGLTIDVDDVVNVAADDTAKLEDITIETTTKTFGDVLDAKYDITGTGADMKVTAGDDYAKIVLTTSPGFEFLQVAPTEVTINDKDWPDLTEQATHYLIDWADSDDDEIIMYLYCGNTATMGADELVISGLEIDSEDAKEGDVCTVKLTSPSVDAVEVEVAKVVAQGLTISVDEDEEVPAYYSGVSVGDEGLTTGEDHESVLVTIEETVLAAYNNRDEVELTLPEGVYVVGMEDETATDEFFGANANIESEFATAYKEGDEASFIFEKGTIGETDTDDTEELKLEFRMVLVAEPTFVGPVELGLVVDGEEVDSVTIAEFKAPFTVEAAQNDLVIDYRNTAVPTDIVITEAEAGLWDEGLEFTLSVEEIAFDCDPVVTVNEDDSDMEVKVDDKDVKDKEAIVVEIKEGSDDEAGVITISGLELYMERNLPAGAYDLKASHNAAGEFHAERLLTDSTSDFVADATVLDFDGEDMITAAAGRLTIADVLNFVDRKGAYDPSALTVKEGFVNIITAGRDKDDASFTKKVVVPVGESYIVAGEETVALDVPAYVSAAGYTMLPVRAVAVALGINTNNVLWDKATKTVTILYGQRIITMTVGSKVINVNGSAIPASASVEVVEGRTFLPMRDLATALGVTDITWDAATKTATLNGGVVAE